MVKYNIYKELDTGERILIQTASDVRKVTFKADETGDVRYVVTRIDERGESEETVGNSIIVLAKPTTPKIIETVLETKLQLTSSNFTPNLLVEKSYDAITWSVVYSGTNTLITLEKETQQVFYRYYTYTEHSISKPSDVIVYDPLDLPNINLSTRQISKTKVLLTWDNSYYLRYVIRIDNTEIVLTNETNSIELDITNKVMNIRVYAYKGMKEILFNTLFTSQTIPSKPTNVTVKTYDRIVELNWDKIPDTNYTLYVDDMLIFKNQKIEDIYIFEQNYGTYTISLYAVNSMGQSIEPTSKTIEVIEKPKLFQLINSVDKHENTVVKIELLGDIPENITVKLFNSDYLKSNYSEIYCITSNGSIVPKYNIKEFFKIQYVISDFYSTFISDYSDVFRYVRPRPIQPELQYIRVGETRFNIGTYLFTWTMDNSNMGYSIYKNGILMKKLNRYTNSYVMSCYIGDTVCVHSHIGYEETESNVIHIGESSPNIIKPSNISINYIIGKDISLECNSSFIEDYDYTILLYKEGIIGGKELIGNFYDTSTINFTADKYGKNTYYIQYQDKYNKQSEFSNPIQIEILEKPSNIKFTEKQDYVLITLAPVPKATHYQLYYLYGNEWLTLGEPISELEYILPSFFNNIDVQLKYKAIVDGLDYIYESEISNEFVYNKPDIAFTATVKQVNLLSLFGNKIQIDVQKVLDKEFPIYFNIKITKDNGEEIILNGLDYQTYDNIFMFGNPFGLSFGGSNHNKYFPLTIDLEELCNATIEITGYKGLSSYTVIINYEYAKIPQQTQLTKVKADYKDNDYEYNFEWLLDTNTVQQYYCIENKDTGELYDKIETNTFRLVSDKHINNFTIYSYNVSGRTNEVAISTPFIDSTTATVTNLNKKVQIDIKPVDYTKKYMLYIDDNIYMESEVPVFNLIKFTGTKDITIRCSYIEGIYAIYGKPYTFTYTPNTIEGVYTILKNTLENSIRIQLKNDTIDKDVKYINICSVNNKNITKIIKTLDIPIDDFRFVLELTNEEIVPLYSIYFELVNGWEVNRTNIIELKSGYFRFGDANGNFGFPFLS